MAWPKLSFPPSKIFGPQKILFSTHKIIKSSNEVGKGIGRLVSSASYLAAKALTASKVRGCLLGLRFGGLLIVFPSIEVLRT